MIKAVLLDPPWNERGAGKCKRGADRHYDTIARKEDMAKVIMFCPFWSAINEDAHMYMWVTNNYLPDGLWIMDRLGFDYKTNICWVKNSFGIGRYLRGQHEICLFGTRGEGWQVRTPPNNIPTVLEAPIDDSVTIKAMKRKHSQKPDQMYELIEGRSQGDYLEIFARNTRDQWYSWGNEIEGYKKPPASDQLSLW